MIVYTSPDNQVLCKVDVKFLLQYGIERYGLTKDKWYKLAPSDMIQPAPNNDQFIHIIQLDGKAIPHKPEHFVSICEWRQSQLNKLLPSVVNDIESILDDRT